MLAALVTSSWQIVDQFRSVLTAAQHELPALRIRQQPIGRQVLGI